MLVFIILLINIFLLVRSPTIISNIAQEIKILSCQPFFPEGYGEKAISKMNSQKKIKSIFYGFINFIKNGCNAETLIIDISFKNLQIIKNDRDRAIKNSININPKKVPVNLTWKNKTYKASARLKGDLPTHWTSTQQWSLKFVLKKGLYIYFLAIFMTIWVILIPTTKMAWKMFKDLPEPPAELKQALNYPY